MSKDGGNDNEEETKQKSNDFMRRESIMFGGALDKLTVNM